MELQAEADQEGATVTRSEAESPQLTDSFAAWIVTY